MLHFKASKVAMLVSLLGIGATYPAFATTTWIFDDTGSMQIFDVKRTGVYDITAFGAQGGSSSANGAEAVLLTA